MRSVLSLIGVIRRSSVVLRADGSQATARKVAPLRNTNMKTFVLLSTFLSFATSITSGAADGKVFLCYWGSWSHYRPEPGKFSVADIDPTLCTHLIYAFAKLEGGEITPFDPYLDIADGGGLGMYNKFNELKTKNPQLKTMIAVGGHSEGSLKFSDMVTTREKRKKFVESVVLFLGKFSFDGLDLNWEFPTTAGGKPEDKTNYVHLISELRAAFDPHRYLLTAAVSPNDAIVDAAYDVPRLSKYLDFISVMCYDYFGSWNSYTGHNSPLRARVGGSALEKKFNVEYTIKYWISKGAAPSKLVVGMPLYGRSFTLADPAVSGFGARTTGPGPEGPILKAPGVLAYIEVCDRLKGLGWSITREPNVVAPVAVKGTEWIGYDDAQSLTTKAGFVKTMGLAGAMVWAIEMDDFHGSCTGVKNPLQTAINAALGLPAVTLAPQQKSATGSVSGQSCATTQKTATADGPKTSPAQKEAQKTTSSATAASKPPTLSCPSEGFFTYPGDPHRFYRCVRNGDHYDVYVFDCPSGTVFDEALSTCAFP